MNILRQIVIVSSLNFRNLRQRFWQSLVIVIGMACVSGVLLSMLSVTEGLHQAHLNTGDPRNIIIVSRGSLQDGGSTIPRDQSRIIMNATGIAKEADGSPIADPNYITGIPILLKQGGSIGYARLFTFGKAGALLHPTFRIIKGRMFQPGTHELIVGLEAQSKFKGMDVGDHVTLPTGQWPIVGMFTTGDLLDGNLIGDTETIMQAMRHNTYNTVVARLSSPAAFPTVHADLTRNPLLSVEVMHLPEWNARASAQTSAFFNVLVYGVSIILAVGALFGCFNTMYASTESRTREIATLRALGYGNFAVAVSVILEALGLAALGALIGAAFAWTMYNGVQGDMGWDFFKLTVSPLMISMSLLWAVAVAVLGGLLPAIQATRLPVAEALRAR